MIKEVPAQGYILEASGCGEDYEVGKEILQGEASPGGW